MEEELPSWPHTQGASAPERAPCVFGARAGVARACTVQVLCARVAPERARAPPVLAQEPEQAEFGRSGAPERENRYWQGRRSGALGRHALARAPPVLARARPSEQGCPSAFVGSGGTQAPWAESSLHVVGKWLGNSIEQALARPLGNSIPKSPPISPVGLGPSLKNLLSMNRILRMSKDRSARTP